MHLANLAVYLGLRSKKNRKQRRSRTVEKQRSKEAGKQQSKKMPKTGNKIIPPKNSSPFDAPLSHKASWRSPARWDLQSFMFRGPIDPTVPRRTLLQSRRWMLMTKWARCCRCQRRKRRVTCGGIPWDTGCHPNCPALEDLETPQAAPEVPEAPRAWALVAKLVQLEIYGS